MVLRMKNSMSVYPLYHNDIYVLCTYTYFAYIVKENSLLVKSLMGNQKFRDRKDCDKHKVPAVDILANFWILRVYIYILLEQIAFSFGAYILTVLLSKIFLSLQNLDLSL